MGFQKSQVLNVELAVLHVAELVVLHMELAVLHMELAVLHVAELVVLHMELAVLHVELASLSDLSMELVALALLDTALPDQAVRSATSSTKETIHYCIGNT
jgi:hypothetical protein